MKNARRNNQNHNRGSIKNRIITRPETKIDFFDFRFQGGQIRTVRGPSNQVMHYLKRHVENRNALVAAGLSGLMVRGQPLVAVTYLAGQFGRNQDMTGFVPKDILDQAKQVATFYQGAPIQFTWTHLISWLERGVKIAVMDQTGLDRDLIKVFGVNLANLVFKDGYVRGASYRTNSLLFIGADGQSRDIFAWDGLNFTVLPKVTDKPVCNAVFQDSILLQAEVRGDYLYALTAGEIGGYLNRLVAKPTWIKSEKIGNIQDIALAPMDTPINTLIITQHKDDAGNRYQLVNLDQDNGRLVIARGHEFQVKNALGQNFDRIVRVTPTTITTLGNQDQTDKIGFLPINSLPPVLGENIAKILTAPVTATPANVM